MSFSHSAAGGATDGIFVVTLVGRCDDVGLPSTLPAVERRPGGTIATSLECRVRCGVLLATPPCIPLVAPRAVLRLADGSVGSWGLFPSRDLGTRVTLPTDFSPSGYGVRRLTPRELSDLWNTPILLQDALIKGGCEATLQEKWNKAKLLIAELGDMIKNSTDGLVNRKRLEQIRGFLIYVSRTYPWMPPYLKGLHLTIDSWRPGRDKQGFKLKAAELRNRPYVQWDWESEDWVDLTL